MRKTVTRIKKGFTLVEVIIVLVIMAIIASVGAPSVVAYIKHTAERTCSRQMKDTLGEIRSAAVSHKYDSTAAVSIQVYKALSTLPMIRLTYPASVQLAKYSEQEALETGTLTGSPLTIYLSPDKAAVEDEYYTVNWNYETSGGKAFLVISMKCSHHEKSDLSDRIPLSIGADIMSPDKPSGGGTPGTDEEAKKEAVLNAGTSFMNLGTWTENKKDKKRECTIVLGDGSYHYFYQTKNGKLKSTGSGGFEALAAYISEQSGLEVEKIQEFILNEDGTIKSITVVFAGRKMPVKYTA